MFLPDNVQAETMKGTDVGLVIIFTMHHFLHAILHFPCCLVGEGHCINVFRIVILFQNQPCNFMRDNTRLAATRAGKYQEGRRDMADSRPLLSIEAG